MGPQMQMQSPADEGGLGTVAARTTRRGISQRHGNREHDREDPHADQHCREEPVTHIGPMIDAVARSLNKMHNC